MPWTLSVVRKEKKGQDASETAQNPGRIAGSTLGSSLSVGRKAADAPALLR